MKLRTFDEIYDPAHGIYCDDAESIMRIERDELIAKLQSDRARLVEFVKGIHKDYAVDFQIRWTAWTENATKLLKEIGELL
jgi:hypothetical protein